jgi:hypothetical protein
VNFLGGPAPTARIIAPSRELAAEKEAFAATRRHGWFGLHVYPVPVPTNDGTRPGSDERSDERRDA